MVFKEIETSNGNVLSIQHYSSINFSCLTRLTDITHDYCGYLDHNNNTTQQSEMVGL